MSYLFVPLAIGPWQIAVTVLLLFIVVLPVIALVDILRSRFKDNDKLIWVIVVLLFNLIGSVLYFSIGRKRKIND